MYLIFINFLHTQVDYVAYVKDAESFLQRTINEYRSLCVCVCSFISVLHFFRFSTMVYILQTWLLHVKIGYKIMKYESPVTWATLRIVDANIGYRCGAIMDMLAQISQKK